MFLSGCVLYAINNFDNKSVLFGVIFICGDWSSSIGGFIFISIPFIYRLFSSWIFQYMFLCISSESQQLFFPIPPDGIAYVKPIFTLISIFLSRPPRPPWPPLPWPLLSTLNPLPDELTCRLRPYVSYDGWVGGKGRDITVDKYVEAVLKLALWIDL